ncbi:hypothetical protein D3C83_303500 [compost metagenome]
MHGDVESAGGNNLVPNTVQDFRQPLCQRHSAALNSDEDDVAAFFVSLGDFVRDTRERTLHRGRI